MRYLTRKKIDYARSSVAAGVCGRWICDDLGILCVTMASKRSFGTQLLHVAKQDSVILFALFFCGLITGHTAKERILAWGTLYRLMEAEKRLPARSVFLFKRLWMRRR